MNKVRLGDYVRIKTGKLDANASSPDGDYPFFTCAVDPLRINTYSYDCECVLVAGNGDLNVKYYNGKFDAYQRTYIIESKDKMCLCVPYLYRFLDNYIDTLRNQSIGGVIKYIKLGNLTEAPIEIPALETQTKTVNVLSFLDSLIEKANQQKEKMDELIKSRFVEMFDSLNNYTAFSDLCTIITDGTHQPPKFVEEGIPFLFVSNIVTNSINFEAEKFISEDTYNELYKRTPIEIGDIIMSTVGSYGHPAVVTSNKKFLFQRHIAYLKPKKEIINPLFLHSAILSEKVQEQIERRVKGIAQKTLNLSEIKQLRIPLPDLHIQNQFADFVTQVEKQKATVQQSIDKLETLKKSLMQEYFG